MNALSVRMRPDLAIEPHGLDLERYWIVKDPVSLQFFRLRDEEHEILRMLDGRLSFAEIRERFEQSFAPLRLTAAQLQGFLWRLHELGLIVTDAPGQAGVLKQRADATRQKTFLAAVTNPFAIRLPGFPAATIVDWLYLRLQWIFTPGFLLAYLALVVIAAMVMLLGAENLAARLPEAQAFFQVQSFGWFLLAIMGIKTLHELGHALVCRHYGGRCPEIGVMFLVFSPTLYTDVTDAWRMESKWKRIFVSAAGMLVELGLAAVAALIWSFSEPGLLNGFCLRVMFVCAVGSLLFNGNPLLRADGYYILSDLIGAPNLWQDSRALLQRRMGRWLLGIESPEDPTIPERLHRPLMIYAVVSQIYCWMLMVGILWFCFRILEPQGLAALAWGLAAVVVCGMVIPPVWQLAQTLTRPSHKRKIHRGRATLSGLALLSLVALIALVPLPFRVATPFWLDAANAQPIYVSTPGTLLAALPSGATVALEQSLATLVSPELEQRLLQTEQELQQQELRLKHLRVLLSDDPTVGPLIPAAEKACEDARERQAQLEREVRRLRLESPAAGVILPPPALPAPSAGMSRLASWHGSPLDATNRGAYLETGTLLCLVGDPQQLEATLVIEQSDVALVRVGQRVRLAVGEGPASVLMGTISEIARADAENLSPGLVRALALPLKEQKHTNDQTAETLYQARVVLDSSTAPLSLGMTGRAKIFADWQPLSLRVWRYVQRTFRLGQG